MCTVRLPELHKYLTKRQEFFQKQFELISDSQPGCPLKGIRKYEKISRLVQVQAQSLPG